MPTFAPFWSYHNAQKVMSDNLFVNLAANPWNVYYWKQRVHIHQKRGR